MLTWHEGFYILIESNICQCKGNRKRVGENHSPNDK